MNIDDISDAKARQLLESLTDDQLQKLKDSISPSELKAEVEKEMKSMSEENLKEYESNEIEFKQKVVQSALMKIIVKKTKIALSSLAIAGGAAAGRVAAANGASGSVADTLTPGEADVFAPFIERMKLSGDSSPDIAGGADVDFGEVLDSVLESVGEAISSVDWGEIASRLFRGLFGGG